MDRNKCETGCKTFTGGEVLHHKDCVFYPDSLSRKLSQLEKACQTVVDGYEGDGMEGMRIRDEVFYETCKNALDNK